MKTAKATSYELPDKSILNQIVEALSPDYSIRHTPGRVQRVTVLDNVDLSLWHSDMTFACLGPKDFLLEQGGSEFGAALAEAFKSGPPLFWSDFPEGLLQSKLRKNSRLRALMPIATVRRAVHRYELLNRDDKIVLRMEFVLHYSGESEQSRKIIGHYVALTPLRGYDDAFIRVNKVFQQRELKKQALPTLKQLLIQQGFEPKPGPKRDFGLKKSYSAEQAFHRMGLTLLTEAETHYQGLIDDIDTEFLHQYRVHLRKLRTLTSLMKGCLPKAFRVKLKNESRVLFAPTNRLRDLDVLLLGQEELEKLLPAQYQSGLDFLFRRVKTLRHQSYRALVKTLKSKAYRQRWQAATQLLEAEPKFENDQSRKPIKAWAKKRIFSRYQQVCRLGRNIDDQTEDEEIHQLRIECKKLRYLMDFYKELFDPSSIKRLILQVKDLQDILGDFNDFSVQQVFLLDIAKQEKSASVQAAVNGLVAVLHQKQLAARRSVQGAFTKFDQPKNAKSIRNLA